MFFKIKEEIVVSEELKSVKDILKIENFSSCNLFKLINVEAKGYCYCINLIDGSHIILDNRTKERLVMLLKMTKGAEIFIKMTDLLESFSKDFSDAKKEFEKKLKEIDTLKEKLEVEQRLIAKLNLIEEADSVIKQYGLVESIGSKEDGIFDVRVDGNFGYKVLGCRKEFVCISNLGFNNFSRRKEKVGL